MKKLALLIPHYNNPNGLIKTIKSINILLDIYIVDDGSSETFNEEIIIKSYEHSGKIYFIYLTNNLGIERALNTGINEIYKNDYEYIARIDCGDIVCNNRFTKQLDFLDHNPEIFIVGSWCDFIDLDGNLFFRLKVPENHKIIKKKMYLNCMFIHPSVMFRTKAINYIGMYPVIYPAAEDYAYFFKFVKNFKTANIQEVLVKVEYNPKGISANNRNRQVISRLRIILDNFHFNFYPIYGIIRNIILLIIPLKVINIIKKQFFEKIKPE